MASSCFHCITYHHLKERFDAQCPIVCHLAPLLCAPAHCLCSGLSAIHLNLEASLTDRTKGAYNYLFIHYTFYIRKNLL